MLIFDSFPDRAAAERFVAAVKKQFGLGATVHDSPDESSAIGPFPFALFPPVVLVERASIEWDRTLEHFVERFGGEFAGT